MRAWPDPLTDWETNMGHRKQIDITVQKSKNPQNGLPQRGDPTGRSNSSNKSESWKWIPLKGRPHRPIEFFTQMRILKIDFPEGAIPQINRTAQQCQNPEMDSPKGETLQTERTLQKGDPADRKHIYICIYTYTYTYTAVYIYIYIYTGYMYWRLYEWNLLGNHLFRAVRGSMCAHGLGAQSDLGLFPVWALSLSLLSRPLPFPLPLPPNLLCSFSWLYLTGWL